MSPRAVRTLAITAFYFGFALIVWAAWDNNWWVALRTIIGTAFILAAFLLAKAAPR